jgi:hypothetical protein
MTLRDAAQILEERYFIVGAPRCDRQPAALANARRICVAAAGLSGKNCSLAGRAWRQYRRGAAVRGTAVEFPVSHP